MNGLSWLIYWSSAISKLGMWAVVLVVLLGLALLAIAALQIFDQGDKYAYRREDEADRVKQRRDLRSKWFKPLLGVWCTSLLIAVVAPSQDTMVAIIASEIGEDVLTSEPAQELGAEAQGVARDSLRVMRKFLDEQLAEGDQ